MASSHPSGLSLRITNRDMQDRAGSSGPRQKSSNTKIIVISVVVLVVVILLIIALNIYARWCWRRSSRRQLFSRRQDGVEIQPQEPVSVGLDRAIVDSLPTVTFKIALPQNDVQECSVCLCEFQENDVCRVLPKCSHSFHTGCIDTWFLSHSTCPLCRTSAEPSTTASAGRREEAYDESLSVFLFPQSEDEGLDELDENGRFSSSELSEGETTEQQSFGGSECPVRSEQTLPSPGWSWRRSTSDRFPQNQGVQFPTNVLFWGNHAHVSSRVSSLSPRLEHGQGGGRSLSNIVIEISGSASFEDQSTPPTGQQLSKSPGTRLNAFKRLLSRERKVFPTEQGGSNSAAQNGATVSGT